MTITASREQLDSLPAANARPEGYEITATDGTVYNWAVCSRCGGLGRYSFNLLDGDKCYGCYRACGLWVEAKVYARRLKDRARRAAKRVAAAKVVEAQLANQLARRILVAHEAALAEAPEQEARLAAKAARPAYPAGVQAVEATVVSIQLRENPYAYNSSTFKLLADLEHGYRVWMTCPQALLDADAQTGDRVEFTASFKVSDDDVDFGFASRPRKVRVLQPA